MNLALRLAFVSALLPATACLPASAGDDLDGGSAGTRDGGAGFDASVQTDGGSIPAGDGGWRTSASS